MELKISYKHLESTPSIEEKIHKKAEKLKKYFHGKIHVDWICSIESGMHNSEVTVRGGHLDCHATAVDDSLYKTFDEVVAKLERQLGKKFDQMKEKIHRDR